MHTPLLAHRGTTWPRRWWIALLAAIAPLAWAGAATINVAPGSVAVAVDGNCSLLEALESANADLAPNADCTDGIGADDVVLAAASTYTLNAIASTTIGNNGLPAITSDVNLNGNGATITRDPMAPTFRIVFVESGTSTFSNLTISNGVADVVGAGSNGGGIYATSTTGLTLTLTDVTLSGNQAAGGGGLAVDAKAVVTVERSTVSGNNASSFGAGIWSFGTSAVLVRNTTISGNTGATAVELAETSSFDFDQLTITDNSGFGLAATNGVINNSIVADNAGGNCNATPIPTGANLADDATCTGFTELTTAAIALQPLGANGGSTLTHALGAGSLAVDAVGAGQCVLATDQRGIGRPIDGNGDSLALCDAGAFEAPAGTTAPPSASFDKAVSLLTDPDGDMTPSRGDTLRYTLTITNTGALTLLGVTLTDTPDPNTALIVGSVTTNAGVVTSGNNGGDTSVGVAIGDLAPAASAIVTFDVLVPAAVPDNVTTVSNQATITAGNLAATASNDPATGAAGDPTVTTLAAVVTTIIAIPTTSSLGLLLFAGLLAGGALVALRRR